MNIINGSTNIKLSAEKPATAHTRAVTANLRKTKIEISKSLKNIISINM